MSKLNKVTICLDYENGDKREKNFHIKLIRKPSKRILVLSIPSVIIFQVLISWLLSVFTNDYTYLLFSVMAIPLEVITCLLIFLYFYFKKRNYKKDNKKIRIKER